MNCAEEDHDAEERQGGRQQSSPWPDAGTGQPEQGDREKEYRSTLPLATAHHGPRRSGAERDPGRERASETRRPAGAGPERVLEDPRHPAPAANPARTPATRTPWASPFHATR